MSAAHDAARQLADVRSRLMTVEKSSADDEMWRQVFDLIDTTIDDLDTIANPCLQCGLEHGRRDLFCSDKCRAANYRSRMPIGKVASSRRLARDRASIVVHYTPDEAERAIKVLVGDEVYLGKREDPAP